MILIEGLCFSYPDGIFNLEIPHLNIPPEQACAVIGPSGSGKTTLLNLMAGILTVRSGVIKIGDAAVSRLSETARRLFRLNQIGMIFQDFQLIEYLSVIENIVLPARLASGKLPDTAVLDKAASLLSDCGLAGYANRRVTRLSQGERQRVAICRALIMGPRVILADEPTGNLDPHTAGKVLDLLLHQTAVHKATLVMVTHDHSLLDRFQQVVPFEQFLKAAVQGSDAAC
ncbi:MAG: ABC transporter ATP-binding protein [Planctomyces sp.]|nr:ABC transporter ATP-binding protein [Planctomyces sp.]